MPETTLVVSFRFTLTLHRLISVLFLHLVSIDLSRKLYNREISEVKIDQVDVYQPVRLIRSPSTNCTVKDRMMKRSTLLHPSCLRPGVTFTREYTRQRSTDCVGVPRLPPSTPRTVQQTLQRKSVREKEKEGKTERERKRDGCACATRREKRDREKDDRVLPGPGERERKRVCLRESSWSQRARVCSVFRMHGTSAACPRPPEL